LKRYAAITILLVAVLGLISDVQAQYETEKEATIPLKHFYIKRQGISPFRRVLSRITFGLSTGYGSSTLSHELNDFGILQNPGRVKPTIFRIDEIGNPGQAYSNWLHKAQPFTSTTDPLAFVVTSEDSKIGFRAKAFHIPLKATMHYEFLERYRIGLGYSFEYTHLGTFSPISHKDDIRSYSYDSSTFFLKKYFVMLGASVYRYDQYLLVVDANIGGYSLGKKFDKGSMKKGININLGVAVEREMSEYFRLFIRPSYDIKAFTREIPDGPGIKHKFNAFYVNVGATYRIPELRRCFLKECHAQINHAHGDREYRSRRHSIWKKQNPHYGENYPTLIKYKGRNKKKLSPY
jgi:hypothetical protein